MRQREFLKFVLPQLNFIKLQVKSTVSLINVTAKAENPPQKKKIIKKKNDKIFNLVHQTEAETGRAL